MDKFCKNLKKTIISCDLFATYVTFRINNEIEYKSIVGGLSSIIIMIFVIIYLIYEAIPFVKWENLNFIFSNKIIESDPVINLREVNFGFAFGIHFQKNGELITDNFHNYLKYSINLIEIKSQIKKKEFPIKVRKCSKMDFYNLLNNTFDKIELNNYFCSDINNNIEFNLKGLFTNDIYKYLELNIELSDYGMNNINEFQNLIEDNPLEVIIYFSESTIDYTKRKKPLSLYLNYITKLIDFNFYKQSNILFSKIEFTNDDALMFSNEKTINGICLDKVNDNFEFFNIRVNQRLLGKFIIQASSKILIYVRKYQKLSVFIAEVTGILEEIFLILSFILSIIERQAIAHKLVKNMLKIKGSKNFEVEYFLSVFKRVKINEKVKKLLNINCNDQIKKESSIKIHHCSVRNKKILEDKSNSEREKINSIKLFDNSLFMNSPSQKKSLKSNEENKNLNQIKKAEEDFASMNIFSTIFVKLCFWGNIYNKRKYELLIKAENTINYFLEIFNYIQRMNQIDLLKYYFLNKDQLILFDYLSFPPFNTSSKQKIGICQNFNEKEIVTKKIGKREINELYNSFNTIMYKDDVNNEDSKLLHLLHSEIEYLN